MKIVQVSFYYDERLRSPHELLEQHYTTTGWAEALERKNAEVVVMNRFNQDISFRENNVQYHFMNDHGGGTFPRWYLPVKFLRRIRAEKADIVHLHNFTLSLQTILLRLLLSKKTSVIIQHHGGKSPGKKKRLLHNLLNQVADGFYFTTVEQGKEWLIKKMLFDKIMPVMEGATFFNYADRDAGKNPGGHDRHIARKTTGMSGNPVFLWVGRLDDNKDPLTILAGFEILLEKYPEATLYMIFSEGNHLASVKKTIYASQRLVKGVHLLGKTDHDKIECYYNSADYFVLGSHYEGSGYALSEALRCGCVPVITDIPSFRMMTNQGRLGALFEPGNKDSFVAAVITALKKPLPAESEACTAFFNEALSFDAIAGVAIRHYQKAMERRNK